MGIDAARIGDIGEGICCEGDDHETTGTIITGSPNVNANGLSLARIGDIIITNDSHKRTGIIVGGSPTVNANGLSVARIGDIFDGCFSGQIITGSPNVYGG